jgi:hypothetical protein
MTADDAEDADKQWTRLSASSASSAVIFFFAQDDKRGSGNQLAPQDQQRNSVAKIIRNRSGFFEVVIAQ